MTDQSQFPHPYCFVDADEQAHLEHMKAERLRELGNPYAVIGRRPEEERYVVLHQALEEERRRSVEALRQLSRGAQDVAHLFPAVETYVALHQETGLTIAEEASARIGELMDAVHRHIEPVAMLGSQPLLLGDAFRQMQAAFPPPALLAANAELQLSMAGLGWKKASGD